MLYYWQEHFSRSFDPVLEPLKPRSQITMWLLFQG